MTPEQLLNPRVKIAVKYPGQPVATGTVLHKYEVGGQLYYVDTPGTLLTNGCVFAEIVDEHTHLFKPLQWWEERDKEDMPRYVKINKSECSFEKGSILKAEEWGTYPDDIPRIKFGNEGQPYALLIHQFDTDTHLMGEEVKMHAANVVPTTMEEYLTYINSKK